MAVHLVWQSDDSTGQGVDAMCLCMAISLQGSRVRVKKLLTMLTVLTNNLKHLKDTLLQSGVCVKILKEESCHVMQCQVVQQGILSQLRRHAMLSSRRQV
jgi:hypothetical protein